MKAMKFKISSPEQSKALQEILFTQGYSWFGSKIAENMQREVIYAELDGSLCYSPTDFYNNTACADNLPMDTAKYIADHTTSAGRIVTMDEAIKLVADSGVKVDRRVKSDGLSTSYYQLTIYTKNGSFECEVGDVIEAMVNNDFDLGNAAKAIRRIYEASQGRGKDGIDMKYDKNKINYFVDMFIQKYERRQAGFSFEKVVA